MRQMVSKWLRVALVAALCPSLVGCGSTGVGNPDDAEFSSVSLAIVSEEDESVDWPLPSSEREADAGALADEPLPRGALERAVLVLGRIEWLPCDEGLLPIVLHGPFVVDLLGGQTRQAPPPVDVPPGGLCGFDAALAPALESASLLGRSVLFSGRRGDGVGFLLFADVRVTLRVRPGEGERWGVRVRGEGGERQRLLWAHAPRRWARRMELDSAEPSDWADRRRIIVIDVNRFPGLYARIRARLGAESQLFLDQDGNGSLNPAESAAGAIGSGSTD